MKGHTNPLRRFGFITTNSITQIFSRRVIEHHMTAKERLSLVFAVPNHPWMKASDKAAVRIAMTVAEKGEHEGILAEVVTEAGLNTDTPQVGLEKRGGKVRPNLAIGADVGSVHVLLANRRLAFRGVCVGGDGFFLKDARQAHQLASSAPNIVREIRNGRDFAHRPSPRWAIDAYGFNEATLRDSHPHLYQHLLLNVRESRQLSQRASYRDLWWVFMEPRPELREAVTDLRRYFVSPMTAKHRYFVAVEKEHISDQGLICVASDRAEVLAVLSSRCHLVWALARGGFLGVGNDPRYNNSLIFLPLAFPISVDPKLTHKDPLFAQQERLRELGERLDNFRKDRLAEHSFMTMTGLYNALERQRELENGCDVPRLTDAERDIQNAGLISILKEIHDDIDRAVLSAYGWEDLISELVGKPGATLPSPCKTEAQEQAEEELLTRLVALNHERAVEEKRGLVRWLRPGYQIPKLGVKAPKVEGEHVGMLDIVPGPSDKLKWPSDGLEQIRLVRDILAKAPAPTMPDVIAAEFDGKNTAKRKDRIGQVLETLVATGLARMGELNGQRRYFLPR
ncbi:hypothetical protein [Mesorhizobium sp. M0678]|uniref:hypothetical protein n=1 Tax=Mesorhizobium sp. M0678 TaxID=2956985 RepID=UPI0033397F40